MQKTKTIWIVVVIVIIALIIWGVSASSNKQQTGDQKVIKIGLVIPMTGPGAVFGNSFYGAVKMALADLKDTKNKYELILEDDGTNPSQSAGAASKLINVDKVDAILTITSGTGNAVKPIATANKVPHICVCSDVTVGNTDYNFTNLILPDDEARHWLTEAKKRGIKTIAVIHQNHSGINAITDQVEKLASSYDIQVVYADKWEPSVRDFKTIISKAKTKNPDLYYLVAFPPSLDIVGQEMKDLGITNLSSSAGFGISAKPELFEGYWYNDGNVEDLTFRDRFEKENPGIRFNVRAAPYAYDGLTMMVQAFESGQDVTSYLSNITEYNGQAGRITKEAGTRNFHSIPGLWIHRNGKAEKVES